MIIRVELVMKRGIAWQIATTEQSEEFVRGCFCTKPQICISKEREIAQTRGMNKMRFFTQQKASIE